MKYVIHEIQMNKVSFAALLLGALTLSPLAKAEDPVPQEVPPVGAENLPAAQRDGMKFSEIRSIVSNFGVKIEGDQLVFSGGIPNECTKDRVQGEVESTNGVHSLKIDFPKCRNGTGHLTAAQRSDLRQLRFAIPTKSFDASMDGKFCLKYSANGDGEAGCDPIMANGKQLEHTSTATIATRRADADKRNDERLLVRKIGDLCAAGQFQAIGEELEAAASWLGDLTKILSELGKAKQKSLENAMSKAKTPEELKEAYDALIASGSADQDKALETYLTKRTSMFEGEVNDKSKTVSALQGVIDQYYADVVDAGEDKKAKQAVVWAHTQLGNRLRDDKDYSGAENQYEKALHRADLDAKINIQKEMAKMFLAAAEACIEENKTKPAKCDALAKKARKHMDGAIASQGRKRGDDALEELNGMKMEKIQTFGVDGVNVKVSGYGSFNPYGGMYDQRKRQMYQTGMQEEYMKRIMQMQMGLGFQGGGNTAGGASFFR